MKIITQIILILFLMSAFASDIPLKNLDYTMVDKENNYKEADYINAYCNGLAEYRLNDKSRVDCLTDNYAIEFDWASKWAESIGQSLYYSKMTGKLPAVAIIMKDKNDIRHINKIINIDKNIKVFKIKAYKD